jgi:hypothetical protein
MPSDWPSITVVGSRRTGTSSALRIAAIASSKRQDPEYRERRRANARRRDRERRAQDPDYVERRRENNRRYRERKRAGIFDSNV